MRNTTFSSTCVSPPLLRILTYHRIADPLATDELNPRSVSATPEIFARQMEILARNYRVVSPAEVLAALAEGKPLHRRSVLLTFDDAYDDFAENAWPVMKSLGLPVTLFVPTGFPDEPSKVFWWDRLHQIVTSTARQQLEGTPVGDLPLGSADERRLAVRRLQDHLKRQPDAAIQQALGELGGSCQVEMPESNCVLGWDELRELASEGVSFGAHTRNHKTLAHESLDGIREEVVGSLCDLEREIGRVEPLFCYPDGSHDDRVVDQARQAGVELAFTTMDGPNPRTPERLTLENRLRLCRTNITPRTGEWIFRLRMMPLGSHIDRWRHREKA